MYRILIVDDEFLVRLGLKTTIDWNAHGYEIVGEASNGREALDMIPTCKPDIVLSDIMMPFMDGLEFITEAKKLACNIYFIILSNYENFQYAKTGISLGVSQYILKSEINAETLLSALKSVKKEQTASGGFERTEQKEQTIWLRNILSKVQINRCISAERTEMIPEGLFDVKAFYVAIKYFCNISQLSEQSLEMLSKTMVSLVENEFDDVIYCEMTYKENYYITLICATLSLDESDSYYIEKSQILSRKLKYYFSVNFKGGISTVQDANQLVALLCEAEKARQNCFFGGNDFCVYDKNFQDKLKQIDKIHVSSTKIMALFENRQRQELESYIKEILKQLRAQRKYTDAKRIFIDFLSIASAYMEKNAITVTATLQNKLDYESWDILNSIDEVEDYLCDIFDNIVYGSHKTGEGYSSSVKKSIAYIEANYASNISLTDVAEYVGISKSYLSMLFKQEAGINFVAYLSQYRIEQAKEILITTNHKIYEIADMVGFYSPYYFSKIFKEITKMQCKEYRDMHSVVKESKL
ncbi:response regulator [Lachnospiraceae bacterium ZAX-1]